MGKEEKRASYIEIIKYINKKRIGNIRTY